MKKLVIFDMDGVLIDTEKVSDLSWIDTFKHFRKDVNEDLRHEFVGKGPKHYFSILHDIASNDEEMNEMIVYQKEKYAEIMKVYGKNIKPGVQDLIEWLIANNIYVSVASSTKRKSAEASLKEVGLFEYFDYMLFGDDVIDSKPNPEIYIRTLEYFGMHKEEALIIEDSYYGVLAAKNAEIDVLWVKDVVDLDKFEGVNYRAKFDSLLEAKSYVASLVKSSF